MSTTELDLTPIESRRDVMLRTADVIEMIAPRLDRKGLFDGVTQMAKAAADSAADVPNLIAEIKRLRSINEAGS